jgi:hypothetical protein
LSSSVGCRCGYTVPFSELNQEFQAIACLLFPRRADIELPAAKVKGTKRKREHDPDAPKRPISAYLHWIKASRPEFQAQNPEMAFKDLQKQESEVCHCGGCLMTSLVLTRTRLAARAAARSGRR